MEATYHCWERRKVTGSNPLCQSLSGTQPGLCRAAEMTQTLQHTFLDLWEGGKYKVWKNNTIFQIRQRPGLSPCKLGSIRTLLFATYWLHIEVLIKIKFPTLVSVAYLQWNSVVGSCQKIHSPSSQHLHISKFLLQKVVIPKCPGSWGTEGTEKAWKGSKLWEGVVWRYFTSDLAESWERQKNAV